MPSVGSKPPRCGVRNVHSTQPPAPQVDLNEVRPYVRPDTSVWVVGLECSAVHSSDGRWYDGTITEVRAGTALVRFQGEAAGAEVELDFVKPKLGGAERKRKEGKVEEEAAEAKPLVPKSMEVQPGDSEETIEKKKKKLKMFKRQERKVAMDTQGEGRRS